MKFTLVGFILLLKRVEFLYYANWQFIEAIRISASFCCVRPASFLNLISRSGIIGSPGILKCKKLAVLSKYNSEFKKIG